MTKTLAPTPSKPKTLRRRKMTEEEFLRLPNDGRKYELVNGEVQEVPTGFRHDLITARLIARMSTVAEALGYVTASQAGFRMANENIRCPDVGFTLKERFAEGGIPEGFAPFAPDLAVEVVSPSERETDLLAKVGDYFASGSRMVWLLFPEKRVVKVFTAPFEMTTLTENDELTGGDLLPDFKVRVSELFDL